MSVFSGLPITASALSPQQSFGSSLQQSFSLPSQQSVVVSAAVEASVFACVPVSVLLELLFNAPQPVSSENAYRYGMISSSKENRSE